MADQSDDQSSDLETHPKGASFSLFFVLVFGAVAVIQPYLNLYYQSIGFNGVQIGLVATIGALVVVLLAPQYGNLYDQSRHKRRFLIITTLVALVSLSIVPFISVFLLVVILYSTHHVITMSNISATQNLAFHAGASAQGKNSFGSTRLWGSIGFSVFVLLGGWIYEKLGFRVNAAFYMVLSLGVVFVLLKLPDKIFSQAPSEHEAELNLPDVLKLVVKDRYLWLTVLALALSDPVMDGVRSFEPVIMKQFGLPASVIGISTMLSALLEIPLMLSVDRLITKHGYRKILLFVFTFDLLRRMVVWFFPSGASVFAMTVLNSVSFPLRLFTMVSLVNTRIPKRYTTTALNFVSVTLTGLGYMLSNAIAGVIYDRFGGQQVFLMGAVLCVGSLVLVFASGKPDRPALRSN
ncbi:MAG: MFS transporter [Anaerolineaceae bacterium]